VNGCGGMRLRVVLSLFTDFWFRDFVRGALWLVVLLDETR